MRFLISLCAAISLFACGSSDREQQRRDNVASRWQSGLEPLPRDRDPEEEEKDRGTGEPDREQEKEPPSP